LDIAVVYNGQYTVEPSAFGKASDEIYCNLGKRRGIFWDQDFEKGDIFMMG
jgi:hypothetical protein